MSWSESASLHINSPDRDEFFSDIANTIMKLFIALGVGMIACMPFVFPIMINKQYQEAYLYIPPLVLATIFNVAICLYSQIYLAKKMSKQVAGTTIMGAIINIIINLLFIKYIGLYAAAVSTTISYFVMFMYRHMDLKKYVNIQYEKDLFLRSIIVFTITIYLYYYNHLLTNILSLAIACIYAFLTNFSFLKKCFETMKKKIKHEK